MQESFSHKGYIIAETLRVDSFPSEIFPRYKAHIYVYIYVYRLPTEQSVVWPADKISEPFAFLEARQCLRNVTCLFYFLRELIKDNIVLLDVNERARSLAIFLVFPIEMMSYQW